MTTPPTEGREWTEVRTSGRAAGHPHRDPERPGREEGSRERRHEASVWEWVVAAVSAVLVLAAIGIMAYEGFTATSGPPAIEVQVDSIVDLGGDGYVVVFRASNRGQSTASGLVVEGELRSDTGTVETAQVTISYVPRQSRRMAGLFFTHDPRRHTLELRPKGYDVP